MPRKTRVSNQINFQDLNYFGEITKQDVTRGRSRIVYFSSVDRYIQRGEPDGDTDSCPQPQPPIGTAYVIKLKHLTREDKKDYIFLRGSEVKAKMIASLGRVSRMGLDLDLLAREVDTVFVDNHGRETAIGFFLYLNEQH